MLPKTNNSLTRRLAPLYLAAFFQGFVLWYAVEKLFMRDIGFDDAGIGIMVAAYSAASLFLETPSGILADRWSRKGVLILASIALAISSIICGASNDVATYIFGIIFWGVFWAFYSGTYDSIVYDTLLEETDTKGSFEQYYGKIRAADSIALVLGSLVGGFVAEAFGLQATYYWSVPFVLLSIIALVKFREPQLHKSEVATPLKEHTVATFKAVMQKGRLLPILIVLVVITALVQILYEFNQLWLIALATPVIAYGPANALVLATSGLGGLAASYFKMFRRGVMLITLSLMFISGAGLIVFRVTSIIVAFQVLLGIGLIGISIIFTRLLHDSLPSKVRAGAASAVSTLGTVVGIPLYLSFGYISKELSVFKAAWLIIGLLVLVAVFVIKTLADNKSLAPVTITDELAVEKPRK